MLANPANLLFFYWRKAERKLYLLVYVGPNASSLESARASVTAHTLTAAFPNEGVIYVRSADDVSDDHIRAVLDGKLPSSPSILTRASSRHARKASIRIPLEEIAQPAIAAAADAAAAAAGASAPSDDRQPVAESAAALGDAASSSAQADAPQSEGSAAEQLSDAMNYVKETTLEASASTTTLESAVAAVSLDEPSTDAAEPSSGDASASSAGATPSEGSPAAGSTTPKSRTKSTRRSKSTPLLSLQGLDADGSSEDTPGSDNGTPGSVSSRSSRTGSVRRTKKKATDLPSIQTAFDERSPMQRKMSRRASKLGALAAPDGETKPRGTSLATFDQLRLQQTIEDIEEFERLHTYDGKKLGG